jgi:hypothetical protein
MSAKVDKADNHNIAIGYTLEIAPSPNDYLKELLPITRRIFSPVHPNPETVMSHSELY